MDIAIRRGEPGDALFLTSISFGAKRHWNYTDAYLEAWQDQLTITEDYINNNVIFLAQKQTTIIGYCAIVEVREEELEETYFTKSGFWLDHIYIRPAYIKNGIGMQLIEAVNAYCQGNNIEKLYIESDPHANGFFEKLGAIHIRTLDEEDEDLYLYEYTVPPVVEEQIEEVVSEIVNELQDEDIISASDEIISYDEQIHNEENEQEDLAFREQVANLESETDLKEAEVEAIEQAVNLEEIEKMKQSIETLLEAEQEVEGDIAIIEEVIEDIQEDAEEDIKENVQEDAEEGIQENVQKDVEEGIQESIQEDVQEDIQENVQGDAQGAHQENIQEIEKKEGEGVQDSVQLEQENVEEEMRKENKKWSLTEDSRANRVEYGFDEYIISYQNSDNHEQDEIKQEVEESKQIVEAVEQQVNDEVNEEAEQEIVEALVEKQDDEEISQEIAQEQNSEENVEEVVEEQNSQEAMEEIAEEKNDQEIVEDLEEEDDEWYKMGTYGAHSLSEDAEKRRMRLQREVLEQKFNELDEDYEDEEEELEDYDEMYDDDIYDEEFEDRSRDLDKDKVRIPVYDRIKSTSRKEAELEERSKRIALNKEQQNSSVEEEEFENIADEVVTVNTEIDPDKQLEGNIQGMLGTKIHQVLIKQLEEPAVMGEMSEQEVTVSEENGFSGMMLDDEAREDLQHILNNTIDNQQRQRSVIDQLESTIEESFEEDKQVDHVAAKSEKEKMIAGELYIEWGDEIANDKRRARNLLREFNNTDPEEKKTIDYILNQLFGSVGDYICIEPSFRCNYGYNIHLGDNFYAGFNCVILDNCLVTIGKNCILSPQVGIYTQSYPMEADKRASGYECAKPVTIGDNVWIGGGSIICPGVTIGNNVVVAPGSVIDMDIPDNAHVAGNPAKIIEQLTEQ